MLKFKIDHSPIVVEVHNGLWDAYSQNNPPTPRDRHLLKILSEVGINEHNPNGLYHFNAKWRPFKKQNVALTLTRIEK